MQYNTFSSRKSPNNLAVGRVMRVFGSFVCAAFVNGVARIADVAEECQAADDVVAADINQLRVNFGLD